MTVHRFGNPPASNLCYGGAEAFSSKRAIGSTPGGQSKGMPEMRRHSASNSS